MQVNVGIQLVPLKEKKDAYQLIDAAIALISKSGMKYIVCPFETVVEGELIEIFSLIEKIKTETLIKSDEILINLKIHAAKHDLSFNDKL